MFKKSTESDQLSIFMSPNFLFSGNSLKIYENKQVWINQSRKHITETPIKTLQKQNNINAINFTIKLFLTTIFPINLSGF